MGVDYVADFAGKGEDVVGWLGHFEKLDCLSNMNVMSVTWYQ